VFLQEKRKIIKRVAGLIRLMHDKGFYHGDLNLKNILIDKINPQNVYIIDWDKSRLKPNLNMSDRKANMLRFCRSMAKFKEYGFPITERDQLFFLKNYWQGNKKIQSEIRKLLLRLRFSMAIRSPVWKLSKKDKFLLLL
jgi:tRNA A-37 threonylcarbamoyl transferase component Bud32